MIRWTMTTSGYLHAADGPLRVCAGGGARIQHLFADDVRSSGFGGLSVVHQRGEYAKPCLGKDCSGEGGCWVLSAEEMEMSLRARG